MIFQSTPPARGATSGWITGTASGLGISIHAPREGGDMERSVIIGLTRISIHAPREGGDNYHTDGSEEQRISIHAPREGGDSASGYRTNSQARISIHAPREGGDSPRCKLNIRNRAFQSTPPARGATRSAGSCTTAIEIFQSTPPARGAPRRNRDIHGNMTISIHAPREGGDPAERDTRPTTTNFNPRPPRGGRLPVFGR